MTSYHILLLLFYCWVGIVIFNVLINVVQLFVIHVIFLNWDNKVILIQSSDARLVLRKKKTDHISPLLRSMHWLPVSPKDTILTKTPSATSACMSPVSTPSNICDTVHLYLLSLTLHSTSDNFSLRIPQSKLSTVGSQSISFLIIGPNSDWNKLPLSPCHPTPTLTMFKSNLN